MLHFRTVPLCGSLGSLPPARTNTRIAAPTTHQNSIHAQYYAMRGWRNKRVLPQMSRLSLPDGYVYGGRLQEELCGNVLSSEKMSRILVEEANPSNDAG